MRPSEGSTLRATVLAAFVWMLLAAGSTASPAAGQQVGSTEITQVRFLGNEAFPQDSLQRAIATRPTDCKSVFLKPFCWFDLDFAVERRELRPREVPRDRIRLEIWYRQRGFREAVVDTATTVREDEGAVLTFSIDEGRPVIVRSIDFSGVGSDPANDLGPDVVEELPLEEGDPLNVLRLDATRDLILLRLRNRGYAHAEVYRQSLIPTESPYEAEVTFEVDPGTRATYGAISVTGTRTLDEASVIRTLQFRQGDYYRVDQLLDAQGRLFGMEIVRSAQVSADLESEPDSIVPLQVTIQEANAYRVRSGVGWTSAECLNAESSWTSRNFFGGGRVLRVRGRVSNVLTRQFGDVLCGVSQRTEEYEDLTWLATVDFAQPWIFSTRNSFGASVFAERQSLPDIFIRQAIGLQLALTRSLGAATPLTLSYRPERSQLEAAEVLFCTGFLVCTPGDVSILAGANILAPVGLSFTRDRSNDLLNATRGYRLTIDLEHAAGWTASEFRYDRVSVEGTTYGFVGNAVVAARLRGGWVGSGGFDRLLRDGGGAEIVHPQKRFYAGGASSVRGFGQGRLGPRVLTVASPDVLLDEGCTPAQLMDLSCDASNVAENRFVPRPTGGTRVLEGNLELRFRLGRSFEAVTFGDFGQVWPASGEVSLSELEFSPGVGLRYLSPLGPIRFDLGYRFRGADDLPVITSSVREADPGECEVESSRCFGFDGVFYVSSGELGILSSPVRYAASGRGFQLHFSIGQAF